ncbi:TPA: hypothetical protein ACH3X3_006479 [Trebouxia sp. C0006]
MEPTRSLMHPAIDLARFGCQPNPYLVSTIASVVSTMEQYPLLRDTFLIEMPNGSYRAPTLGETCCQRLTYADTLEDIADRGSEAVYNPETAAMLAEEIQILQRLEQLGEGGGELENDHLLIEAFKHVYALRTEMGDPDFTNNTALDDAIDSQAFAVMLAETVQANATQPPTAYGGSFNVLNQPSDNGTTHMSIVDADRGAFAMTSTINTYFGSLVVSDATGIIFNNQMNDFSTPGQANTYGYTPSPANFIVPGKKPLSTMSPTMVDLDGEVRMVVGASGGSCILSTVIQSLLR